MTKQSLLKRISIITAVIVIISLLVTPVSAAVNGNLTFRHGVNNNKKYTYGSTSSTAIENSMNFYCKINYQTGPNSGLVIRYQSRYYENTSSSMQIIYPGSVKGSSLFIYAVDSRILHTSTDWWNFDFR